MGGVRSDGTGISVKDAMIFCARRDDLSIHSHKSLDKTVILPYTATRTKVLVMQITTSGRLTILMGKKQAATGERLTLRRLAQLADVPKDFVYRLDAGSARYVELAALARLCHALDCRLDELLVWDHHGHQPV